MTPDQIAVLTDRGVVRVSGEDALSFLDNLVTNDLLGMAMGEAKFAALLTPQGKILFDFFVVRTGDDFLLDVAREKAADLVKRLSLYKLRAKVEAADLSQTLQVVAGWGLGLLGANRLRGYRDPRLEGLDDRLIGPSEPVAEVLRRAGLEARERQSVEDASYHAHRIAVGVPEGGRDYPFGDTFPHEANMDRLNGVSFSKGCFVGQEVVARMQHKTVVRKRIARLTAAGPLTSGAVITVGEAAIGAIGSVAGNQALAMVRLDRVIEAIEKGQQVTAGGQPVMVDPGDLQLFRDETARKSAEKAARI